MSKEDIGESYALTFWNLTNVVTGFCIVQSLAIYIAVGPHSGHFYDAVHRNPGWMVGGAAVGTAIYIGVISFCRYAQLTLLGEQGRTLPMAHLLWVWYVMQLIIVVVLGAFAAIVSL